MITRLHVGQKEETVYQAEIQRVCVCVGVHPPLSSKMPQSAMCCHNQEINY